MRWTMAGDDRWHSLSLGMDPHPIVEVSAGDVRLALNQRRYYMTSYPVLPCQGILSIYLTNHALPRRLDGTITTSYSSHMIYR